MKNFSAVAQRFPEIGRTYRNDHELLQVEVVVGVRTTVHHIHHRHRHLIRTHAAKVAVQRQTRFFGCRPGHGHGDRQHGIGAQAGFVLGAVEVDQRFVEKGLLRRVQPQHRFGNFGVDVLYRFAHALAQVAVRVAVAQFDGFTAAGGSAGRHSSAAHGA